MIENLYTNRSSHRDFVKNALLRLISQGENVFLAVAFLTETSVVQEIVRNGSHVRLIVRLGFPTSPDALRELLKIPSVDVRFFTHKSFHPKLYIFGDREALVGSANLTDAAINSNQEVMVSVKNDDERFTELAVLFNEYWQQAAVLTDKILDKYEAAYQRQRGIDAAIDSIQRAVKDEIGDVVFHNIGRDKPNTSKENLFLENYRKTYQETLSAFNKVRSLYESFKRRKVNEERIPLRLEIDSFFSFVRDNHAAGDNWENTPIGWGELQKDSVSNCINEWLQTKWPHFEDFVVNESYPNLKKVFSSLESVASSSDDQLFDALLTVHSFHDSLRFRQGGMDGLRREFFKNDGQKIRNSLSYLVFGSGDIIDRMGNVIYNPTYKLDKFGNSNVQELIGWCNKEDYPVVNGRTTKVLRYFGFDVRQLS